MLKANVYYKEQIIASADEVSHTDCEIHLQDIQIGNYIT